MTDVHEDERLDPQMAAALRRMAEIGAELDLGPEPETPDPVSSRQRMSAERRWWNEDLPEMAEVVETTFPGPHGPIPVRILYPETGRPLPVIVYLHGGGWVVGTLDTHHRAMRFLALRSGCAVVAVDYRLAPEHPFPVPLDDCVAAVRHVRAEGRSLGLDPDAMALGGDSAGGNLAVAAALVLRDAGDSPVKAVVSFYGAFEADWDSASRAAFGDGRFGLGSASMRWYYDCYVGPDGDPTDPLVSPMRAELAGLPPVHLFAAELDVLCDDSVAFARRLRAAGVPGEMKIYDGVVHAFINLTRMVDKAHAVIGDAARAVRASLAL